MANDLLEVTGGKARLHLHPGQTKAWESDRRFTFIYAGTQSGKTSFLPWWLKREIDLKGHGDYLAVTSTYDLFKLKFMPEMKHIFCDLLGWKYSASDRVISNEYKPRMFDRIIMRSAESEGGLESTTAQAAVLDECGQDNFSISAWEAVQRRLSLSQGRVLGGTTLYNLGWTKTEIYDRWRGGDPNYLVVQFASTMNPAFPLAEFERAKATLPEWKFKMMYLGQFDRPAGMIYSDLTEEHYIPRFEIPASWPCYIGIDPGPLHTAIVVIAHDPVKDVYYVCKEYLKGDLTTKQHVENARALTQGMNVFHWALGQKSEKQYRIDWQSEGLPVREPSISDVEGGINRVIELIKTKRLYIFDDLSGCKDQFGTYSRKVDQSGQTMEEIKNKGDYHFMDGIRYSVIGMENHWLTM